MNRVSALGTIESILQGRPTTTLDFARACSTLNVHVCGRNGGAKWSFDGRHGRMPAFDPDHIITPDSDQQYRKIAEAVRDFYAAQPV